MGRRRRFVHLDDEDDRAAEARAKCKSSGGCAGSSGSNTKEQPLSQQRRRIADQDEEEDVEREEEEEDNEKDLEAMRTDVEETKIRRGLGRPRKRAAPESDEEQEEEGPRDEENTEAVPIRNPVEVTGKGKKQKKHYASFEYEGNTFELEDPVLLTSGDRSQKPYVSIIKMAPWMYPCGAGPYGGVSSAVKVSQATHSGGSIT